MKHVFLHLIITILVWNILHSQSIVKIYNGIVNDDAVRIRVEPSLDSTIIGRLDKGWYSRFTGERKTACF